MLLRYSAAICGRHARQLPSTLASVSSLAVPAAVAARTATTTHIRTQLQTTQTQTHRHSSTTTSHGIPGLPHPFQLWDLSRTEVAAYELHGPNYIEQLTGKARADAEGAVRRRQISAMKGEERLGPNWYAIRRDIQLRREAYMEEYRQRKSELGKAAEEEIAKGASPANVIRRQRDMKLKLLKKSMMEFRDQMAKEGGRD